MPTLVVRYEVDDNAVDDVVKGPTAVAANKQGPMASVDLLATGRQHQVPRARDSPLVDDVGHDDDDRRICQTARPRVVFTGEGPVEPRRPACRSLC
jgi:hypothetical protein